MNLVYGHGATVQNVLRCAYDRILLLMEDLPSQDILNVLGYVMAMVAAIEGQQHTQGLYVV